MATYIKCDLAAQLRSGQHPVVRELTLDSLAAYYNVCYTPVRMAINELLSEGLLVRGPNRRLTVATRPRRRSVKLPPSRPERPRDLFKVISTDLVGLSLRGEAVFLREEVTAEKYGVSRTVIRNILHRLAGEGLLEHLPRRGWRLQPFRMDDLRAFTDVREVLELKALELARPKLVPEELQRMLEANAPPRSPDDNPRSDESLHDYFIALAGNAHIKSYLEGPVARFYRLLLKWEEAFSRDIAVKVAEEHSRVLASLLQKNWRGARQALSDHIRGNNRFWDELREIMRDRGTPIGSSGVGARLESQNASPSG